MPDLFLTKEIYNDKREFVSLAYELYIQVPAENNTYKYCLNTTDEFPASLYYVRISKYEFLHVFVID